MSGDLAETLLSLIVGPARDLRRCIMQRENMGQLSNTEVPGERESESRLSDSRRHCINLCKELFVRVRGSFVSVRSVLIAGVLLSLFVTSSFAQAQQPYTATLQPRS